MKKKKKKPKKNNKEKQTLLSTRRNESTQNNNNNPFKGQFSSLVFDVQQQNAFLNNTQQHNRQLLIQQHQQNTQNFQQNAQQYSQNSLQHLKNNQQHPQENQHCLQSVQQKQQNSRQEVQQKVLKENVSEVQHSNNVNNNISPSGEYTKSPKNQLNSDDNKGFHFTFNQIIQKT